MSDLYTVRVEQRGAAHSRVRATPSAACRLAVAPRDAQYITVHITWGLLRLCGQCNGQPVASGNRICARLKPMTPPSSAIPFGMMAWCEWCRRSARRCGPVPTILPSGLAQDFGVRPRSSSSIVFDHEGLEALRSCLEVGRTFRPRQPSRGDGPGAGVGRAAEPMCV